MGRIVKERCIHCLKVMRNDGTADNPKWVCNNLKCIEYVPPTEDEDEGGTNE
jgi:hypothetical protein